MGTVEEVAMVVIDIYCYLEKRKWTIVISKIV